VQQVVEKLTWEPLSIDQLLEYLAPLKELVRARNLIIGRKAGQYYIAVVTRGSSIQHE